MSDNRPPEGIDPEILAAALASPAGDEEENDLGCDAYALWAAMTRLGHEVKLQGRAFAALRERLEREQDPEPASPAGTVVEEALGVFREELREAERRTEAARRRAERTEEDLLATLADVHDRLALGLDAARRVMRGTERSKGWLGGLFSREPLRGGAIDSLVEGQELALRRVADELARLGLREIPVLGEDFNPETMRAVAVDSSGTAPDGTVVAVVRSGWARGGEIWRTAEVTVAKKSEGTAI